MQSMPRSCPSLASTPSQQHTISSGPSLLNPFCLPVCATPVLPASRLLPQTNTQLSSGRRKRAVPEGTATPEAIGAFTLKGSFPLHKTTQPGILALALHPTEVRGMGGAVTPLQYRGTGGGRGCCTPALWAACAAHSFVAGCTAGLWVSTDMCYAVVSCRPTCWQLAVPMPQCSCLTWPTNGRCQPLQVRHCSTVETHAVALRSLSSVLERYAQDVRCAYMSSYTAATP
jgi:hypothetical protein